MSDALLAGFTLIGLLILYLGIMVGYDLRSSQINDILRREKARLLKERLDQKRIEKERIEKEQQGCCSSYEEWLKQNTWP